jgi:endogenous inhibitor of DNA gyrase (YacG/DUF329 family)
MAEKPSTHADKPTPCPTCKNPVNPVEPGAEFYPFCCKRCRQIDLGRWLQGDYVISRPIEQSDLEEGT